MNLRIYTVCCAILFGLATAVQAAGPHSSDISDDDIEIAGSGDRGELRNDLESSGSGSGPDDEDAVPPHEPDNHPTVKPNIRGGVDIVVNKKVPAVENIPSQTEDPSVIMNPKPEERATSFFAQPGILAAVIGGAVVGLLCAILVVMFIVYRMRKKDEGSYALGEPKQSPTTTSYSRGGNNKEFYA